MKKKLLAVGMILVLCMSLFTSCGGGGDEEETAEVYRGLYSADVSTLNYLNTTYTNDMGIPANTQEWLIQYDKYGNVQPALAKDWTVSDDELTWTFNLRDDVNWYNYKGEKQRGVVAQDFVNAAEYALKYGVSASYMFPAAKIKNSDASYEDLCNGTVKWEDVGIKAVDDHTLVYELDAPCPYFLSCLTYGCFVPIADEVMANFGEWDKRAEWGVDEWNAFSEKLDGVSYDQLWYNGAYYLSVYNAGEKYTMTKNPEYFEADQVYINSIEEIYNAEAGTIAGEMFQRGEVESASISATLAKSWSENDDTRKLFTKSRLSPSYSYFWSLNFDPQFDAEFEPDNWKLAVNNENFRKSIMYGINRVGVLKIQDDLNAEALLQNTITPATFVAADGHDYADAEVFDKLAVNKEGVDAYFNEDLAKECRDKAKAELEAKGAKFPVIVLLKYNPSVDDWAAECTYMEKQLEELLGTDYIDIIVEQGPTQSFLSQVRRAGDYALLKTNYGCDYADPLTYADPFGPSNNYAFMYKSEDPETQKICKEYYAAIEKADSITAAEDTGKRYEAFAEAEAILIDHAMAIPLGLTGGGYQAIKVNPFEGQYAPFGVSTLRYKGQKVLAEPFNVDDFDAGLAKWEEERAKASK